MPIGAGVAVVISLVTSEYWAGEITCMPTIYPRHRGSEASGSHAHRGIHAGHRIPWSFNQSCKGWSIEIDVKPLVDSAA
jgi:hypothetical protein